MANKLNLTYNDFLNEAKNAGVYDTFSAYDLQLAEQNPEYGIQLVNAKNQWKNATTDADRLAANTAAENIRKQFNYSGGSDGSAYNMLDTTLPYTIEGQDTLNNLANTLYDQYKNLGGSAYDSQITPIYSDTYQNAQDMLNGAKTQYESMGGLNNAGYQSDFTPYAPEAFKSNYDIANLPASPTWNPTEVKPFDSSALGNAPTYQSEYKGKIDNAIDALGNYGSFQFEQQMPQYTSRYDNQMQDALTNLTNTGKFEYDAATDPLYQAYAKAYRREGERSMQSTLAQSAALTGGVASSAAIAAAQQANNYYNSQLSDRLASLYSDAYNRYLQEFSMNQDKLSALQNAERMDRDLYNTQLGQYNTDRNFAFDVYRDAYGQKSDYLNALMNQDNNAFNQNETLRDQWNRDRAQAYQEYRDTVGDTQFNDQMRYSSERDAYNDAYNRILQGRAQDRELYEDSIAAEKENYNRTQTAKGLQREAEQTAYNRYRDALANSRTEYNDAYNRALTQKELERDAANTLRNSLIDANNAYINAAEKAYWRQDNDLSRQYEAEDRAIAAEDRARAQKYEDEDRAIKAEDRIRAQRIEDEDRAISQAMSAAEIGDFSRLAALGFDITSLVENKKRDEFSYQFDLALQAWTKFQNPTLLNKLGYSTDNAEKLLALDMENSRLTNENISASIAQKKNSVSGGSGGSGGGKVKVKPATGGKVEVKPATGGTGGTTSGKPKNVTQDIVIDRGYTDSMGDNYTQDFYVDGRGWISGVELANGIANGDIDAFQNKDGSLTYKSHW